MNPDDRNDHLNDAIRYWFSAFGFRGSDGLFHINANPDPQPQQPDPELTRLMQDVSTNRNRPEE